MIFYSNNCFDDIIVLEGPSSRLVTRSHPTLTKKSKEDNNVTILETPPVYPFARNKGFSLGGNQDETRSLPCSILETPILERCGKFGIG